MEELETQETGSGLLGTVVEDFVPDAAPKEPTPGPESVEETYTRLGFVKLPSGEWVSGDAPEATAASDEGTEDEESDAPAAAAPGSAQPPPESTPDFWVTELQQRPQRWSEVPTKLLRRVVQDVVTATETRAEAAIAQSRAAAVAEARAILDREATSLRKAGRDELLLEAELESAAAQITALRKEDPAGYVDWQEKNPEAFVAYSNWMRDKTKVLGEAKNHAEANSAIAAAAQDIVSQLEQTPAAYQEMLRREKVQPGRYQVTRQGLANLVQDSAEIMANLRIAATATASSPKTEATAVAKRQAAAVARRDIPKPPSTIGNGVRSGGGLTEAQLAAMSVHDAAKLLDYERKHGKGDTERLLASSSPR